MLEHPGGKTARATSVECRCFYRSSEYLLGYPRFPDRFHIVIDFDTYMIPLGDEGVVILHLHYGCPFLG